MGNTCCSTRMKPEDEMEDMLCDGYALVNTLPSYENMHHVYTELGLPMIDTRLLSHKKERMVFMIVNIIRTKPALFMQNLTILQDRCHQRQSPTLHSDDIGHAMSLLRGNDSIDPLNFSTDLSVYSINMLNREKDLSIPLPEPTKRKEPPLITQQLSPRSKKP